MLTRERLIDAALLGSSALLAWLAWRSLDWRMVHDPPLLLFQASLMDRFGLVPYRDFWDNNPPGTQWLHLAVVRLFGYGDRALRAADLALLGGCLAATFLALAGLGRRAAWGAGVVWGLVYLAGGPGFQRDDVVVLLASLSLAAAVAWRTPPARRAAVIGLLLGAAATVKPPALVALPPLLLYLAAEGSDGRGFKAALRRTLPLLGRALAGAALPLLATFAWLWRSGALGPFVEMARGYWPLYTRLSGGLGTIQSPFFNLYSGYRVFGRLGPWLLPATAGLAWAWRASRGDAERRRRIALLAGLAVAFLAYVGIQGKFFVYHWHPFLYFLVVLSSLALLPAAHDTRSRALAAVPPLVLFGFLALRLGPPAQLVGRAESFAAAPKGGRVDDIAGFLAARLRPGDAVQPLDWTGGVAHAMLITGARPATPFLYDFPFYHHVSEPYVFELRGRFLEALRKAEPRFVVEVPGDDKPWVRGKDTTRDFNKLRRFLEERYQVVADRLGYVVYERKHPAAGDARER